MAATEPATKGPREDPRTSAKKDPALAGKPDNRAYQDKVAIATSAIDDTKAKLKDIRDKINDASGGRDDFNRRKNEIRSVMDELQGRVDELETERKKVIESIEEHRQTGQKMKNELTSMKKSIGYTSEEQINEKIHEIEDSMMKNTLPLKEEKRLLGHISQLRSSKKLVGKYSSMEANSSDANAIMPLKARLDQIGEELRNLRSKKRGESEKFKAILSERQAEAGPLKELLDERDKFRRAHDEQVAARRQHHDAYNASMRQWQANQNSLRVARDEKKKEERIKRVAEQQRSVIERQLEKMEALPFESEVLLLEQTIAYVTKLIEDRAGRAGSPDAANAATKWVADAFKGEGEALLPKSQRRDNFLFTPKKTTLAKKGAATVTKKTGKAQTFKHDIGTLSYFEQCGVHAPVTEDDLEACLKQLDQRLGEHKGQQRDELDKHQERRKDLEAQLTALDSGAVPAILKKPDNPQSAANDKVDDLGRPLDTAAETVAV